MNIIVRIKQLVRKNKGKFCVLDTSVISNYPDIIEKLQKRGIKVIIPESVHHELSCSKKTKPIYYNILKNKKLIVMKPKTNMTGWPVDDQVVETAYILYKKGYDVKLLTCDKDQSNKAERRNGLEVECLPVDNKRNNNENECIQQIKPEEIITIKYVVKGREKFISIKYGLVVFNNKGKRKIGRGNLIPIHITDIFDCQGYKYCIQDITENIITLKKLQLT